MIVVLDNQFKLKARRAGFGIEIITRQIFSVCSAGGSLIKKPIRKAN